jgi:hypothetical protein
MAEELTRSARDELVQRIYQLEASLFRRPGAPELTMAERPLAKERLFATYGEYADRLPRVRLSSCPYCGEPLKRVFDPFGMDGPWWHVDVQVKYDEPAACDHFRVLLGAVNLGDRVPEEVRGEVRPGPEVPFVVPALLALPGMLAVVGRLQLATGDVAYPIAYFSDQPTRPVSLHQPSGFQQQPRDRRQHGVGQDVVHVARAALDLGAAARRWRRPPRRRRPPARSVRLAQPALHLAQLQPMICFSASSRTGK